MVDQVAQKWNNASMWKKFILVNLIIPWTPLVLLMLAFFAPPEVVDIVNETGSIIGDLAVTGWSVATTFF